MMIKAIYWMKTMWLQQRNIAPDWANYSDELNMAHSHNWSNRRFSLELSMNEKILRTGQFICYKTGQIYLLLTEFVHDRPLCQLIIDIIIFFLIPFFASFISHKVDFWWLNLQEGKSGDC